MVLEFESLQCLFVYGLIMRQGLSINALTEALYEKTQSIATYDAEFAKLQAQVEKLESASAQKDTCIADYEAIVKKTEGEVI